MFAVNPFGNTGIICDVCSLVIHHEIDAQMATDLADGTHFCVQCYEKFDEDDCQ
jgi:hypothetical protein